MCHAAPQPATYVGDYQPSLLSSMVALWRVGEGCGSMEHLGEVLQAALRLLQGGLGLHELRVAVLQVLLVREQVGVHMRHVLRQAGPTSGQACSHHSFTIVPQRMQQATPCRPLSTLEMLQQ